MFTDFLRTGIGYFCLGTGIATLIVPFFPSTAMIATGVLLLGSENCYVKKLSSLLTNIRRGRANQESL